MAATVEKAMYALLDELSTDEGCDVAGISCNIGIGI